MLNMYPATPRFVLGATLVILAVIRTLKQSVEMYKATKQWQPNRYIQQFVKDGIVYFFTYVLFIIVPPVHLPSTRINTNAEDVFPLNF
jgi:hypothetical protein